MRILGGAVVVQGTSSTDLPGKIYNGRNALRVKFGFKTVDIGSNLNLYNQNIVVYSKAAL